ncbi:MAG: 1-(5-phosphoribosyl)-5-[(5-phosphoribosylamino)methylideneamino]imidazole-4-carboxamide isomerase [Gracilibacteraceae bacterium]|nr:1-(5-phosphoribosyl)-5-[(5-phosphoribosylamino)methylideneamino]imidazole-4-carboxamide isomerase [Gracilibacteraceae bacterium]
MRLYPAVDLKEGRVVRLARGEMASAVVYASDPAAVAREFAAAGAEFLHVVDLDGAFAGRPVNDAALRAVVAAADLRVQAGGGIRTPERVAELLALGVERVVLGTAAARDQALVREALRRFGPERIVVGIDARAGRVCLEGWAEETDMTATELGRAMRALGVTTVVYTDIARDGMLAGPNIAATVRLTEETGLRAVVSGGVASLADLGRVFAAAAGGAAIDGVITGRALYDGAFTLAEALALGREGAAVC